MLVTAKLNNLRISARKVRMIVDLVRGKTVAEAETILNFAVKRASSPLLKLLKSAIANARNNFHLDEANLYIKKILVNDGVKLKRWMPRARGQAAEIQKKTSHIIIELEEIEQGVGKISEEIKIEKNKEKEIDQNKPKIKPEKEIAKPKVSKGSKRIFRRKSF